MIVRKNMYDIITNPPKKRKKGFLAPVLCCVVPLLFLGAFRFLRGNRTLMNRLIYSVTTPFKRNLSALCGRLPFNVAEVIWTVAVLVVLLFVVRTLWLLITREERLRRLFRRILAACAAALIVYSGYTILWGINYYGDTLSERSGIEARGCTAEELYMLSAALADYAGALSGEIPRNEAGEMEADGTALLADSVAAFAGVQEEFPFLAGNVTAARPMFYSHIISWMGFTGFLFPFTGESLVNVEQPVCLVPATALHELAHQCNVAGESEANFVAVIAGFRSENVTYAYSSALLAYIHVSNALYSADRELWEEARTHLNDAVRADLAKNNAYWARFDTAVEHTSKKIYNSFLQSYDQKDGLESYGKCVDLLIAYYFDLHPDYLESGKL